MNPYRFAAIAIVAMAAIAAAEAPAQALPRGGGGGGTCYCPVQKTVCSSHPGYVPGAKTGDLVFKTDDPNSTSPVARVMHALGLNMTHVGMMLDGMNVRHNTLSVHELTGSVDGTGFFSKVGYFFGSINMGDIYVDPSILKSATQAMPQAPNRPIFTNGLRTVNLAEMQDPDEDPNGAIEYFWPSQVSLVSARDESTNRARATAAAAQLQALQLGYGFYAYSNNDDAINRDGASMCAGSIMRAWQGAGGGGFSNRTYTGAERAADASALDPLLYQAVITAVSARAGGWETDMDELNAAWGVTDQLMNTFAYGQFSYCDSGVGPACTIGSWYQPDLVGPGYTVSPDDLIAQIMAPGSTTAYNPFGAAQVTIQRDYNTCSVQTVEVVCACGGGGGANG